MIRYGGNERIDGKRSVARRSKKEHKAYGWGYTAAIAFGRIGTLTAASFRLLHIPR
jgi:hypothetical protein